MYANQLNKFYEWSKNMGFFKSIGRAIGRGIEKIGDFFGSETISSVGRNIQDACAERVASEKSYEKREANIYTTDRLNEILVSFSEGYFNQATTIENICISKVEEYYDKLISIIESAPGVTYNNANLRALKNGKSRISKNISGGIKEPLAKRMSIDDSECLAILKMDAGNEKKQAMSRFSQQVIKEALNNLAKNVRNTLNDNTEDIQDYLSNISEEQEKEMQAFKDCFDKFEENSELEQIDKEMNCIIPMITLNATDLICNILK